MAAGDFSVATCNLFNLNLPGKRMYRDPDGWSQAEFDRKVSWLGARLADLDADVIGFQELWHGDALAAVFARDGLAGAYDLLVPATANGTRIECAAAVRKGLLRGEPRWIETFPPGFVLSGKGDAQTPEISVNLTGFHRPVLQFEVQPRADGPQVLVTVCHLKSKNPTRVNREDWFEADEARFKPHQSALGAGLSTIRRTAEATALRWILTEQMKGTVTPVIVLGDLNDGQHSNTLNIITDQPRFLQRASANSGGDTALYSAQALQQLRSLNDVYYTHVYQDVRESLDHVLMSEQFYEYSARRVWRFDYLTIDNDHLNHDDHKARGSIDHGIVKVALRYSRAN